MPDFNEVTASANTQPVPPLMIEAVESFNYAAWQNAVPLLCSIVIDNKEGAERSSLTVELSASPAFARPKRWIIDRIGAGERLPLKDIDLEIDPSYLDGLDEAERGVLTFRLLHKGECLHQVDHVLRVLARDEWGGISSMGELLPAFVTPNDPALAPVLRTTAEMLTVHGHSPALDGYQTRDPNRAYLLAAALWSAVAGRSLIYANPPGSFEQVGQKTRRVGTVLSDGLATCLDSTLLFASGLEAIGLNAVMVMTQGHCFAGVWLIEKSFKRVIERDCSEVRKAIAAKELIVFETTLVTHRPAARFPDAVSVATNSVSAEKEHEFVAVIDVMRARMSQVRPLASHTAREQGIAEEIDAAPPPLPASPGYDNMPAEELEQRPSTPAGRIERWQRKLLDLSLRNRLLNFRPTKQSVPVLCPNVSYLEDRLADGARMRLISLADGNPLAQRDAQLHQKRTQKDLDLEFTRRALDRDEVVCPLEIRDLEARLTALFRKAKSDLAEGGSNTLYLAVGFLRWKQAPNDEKTYKAPLLLIPVQLTRRSASSPFYLESHEDDVRFNATLLQLLKKDFDCDLTAFEANLPTDDSGVDVPLILDRMRQAVRDIPGFEVLEEAAIAPFSFAKYLMWRDLVDRVGQLENNRVVRHLIHDPDKAFRTDGTGPMPQSHEIDTRYTPKDIVHPLPADSSQLAAVMAASEGHDMVIVGPPGTGKSQTIANLITQCMAVGKTVLFVAEKTAALDVVHRRLKEHGLGDCCVELHSNKAEKRRFLDQLSASWQNRMKEKAADWITICDQLQVRRDQLNAYAAAVHTPEANGWTAYRAMGECIRGRGTDAPVLRWPNSVQHTRERYDEMEDTLARLATTFQALPANAPLPRMEAAEWSMAWETGFLECCQQLAHACSALASAIQSLGAILGLGSLSDVTSAQLAKLYRLAVELSQANLPPSEILTHAQIETLKTVLNQRHEWLQRSRQATESLEAALVAFCAALGMPQEGAVPDAKKRSLYLLANELTRSPLPPAELVFHGDFDGLRRSLAIRPSLIQAKSQAFDALVGRSFNAALIERIPVDALEREWDRACKSMWPLSGWRKKSTIKKLKSYMTATGDAAPDIDFPLLREYLGCHQQVTDNLASLNLPLHLRELVDKDAEKLEGILQGAQRLRDAIVATGAPLANAGGGNGSALDVLVAAARQLYPPGREIESVRAKLKENLQTLALSPQLQATAEKDPQALIPQIQAASSIQEAIKTIGLPGVELAQVLQQVAATPERSRRETYIDFCRSAKMFQEAWVAYNRQANATPAAADSPSVAADAAAQAEQILSQRKCLKHWTAWVKVRRRAEQLGLTPFVEALQSGELLVADVMARFHLAYARWWLPTVVDRREPLRAFQRFIHEKSIEEFQRLDDQARRAAAPRARYAIMHGLPPSDQVPRKSELGLLRHQMSLKRPSKSIREMIAGIPDSFGKLAPCLLMSPLSIAQYLPAGQAPFDVVVFDEASQIATWDAIGAIARGKQTIIVGDPKQLPPTNFFGKAENDEDNEELGDHEKDLESILDEAQASGLPTLQLSWHYRSRHESLIAFSNWNYYGNRLVTFPAAESVERGVSLRHVPQGIYDRGKSRTNRQEAEAIVATLVERMQRCLHKPERQRLTYGVVTFNSQQQELILDLLDEAQRQQPDLEWFFSDERIEPTVVKNLENVQGDERDVMLFSITFGFDAAGKFPVDFGAINREGGERRLNVAITRARQELLVFASFLPDQLRAERSSARGVRDLKAFLEYADKGPKAIVARIEGSVGDHEPIFEEGVAEAMRQRGWEVEAQIGVSGFRIDLGIVHPDKPGAYLAGIECDGATYHRSAVARDRDKIRQQILENLGWKILRVWSTDWWYDPDTAIEQLDSLLRSLIERDREATSVADSDAANEELAADVVVEKISLPQPAILPDAPDVQLSESHTNTASDADAAASATAPVVFAKQQVAKQRSLYRRSDLGDASAHQSRFFDDDYSETLRQMALVVLQTQGPIRDDALAREVARAHGFTRTTHRIKQRVLKLLADCTTTVEPVGTFLWPETLVQDALPFRYHVAEDERRSLDEIAMQELIGLVRDNAAVISCDDPALALAREIGLARLAQPARTRLEDAFNSYISNPQDSNR